MDSEERQSIERRLGHLEISFAAHSALMARNTEILDDIRTYINQPKRLPECLAACVAVLALCGTLLYTAYISPLEDRMVDLKETTVENRVSIAATTSYATESRRVVDEWIRENSNRSEP